MNFNSTHYSIIFLEKARKSDYNVSNRMATKRNVSFHWIYFFI